MLLQYFSHLPVVGHGTGIQKYRIEIHIARFETKCKSSRQSNDKNTNWSLNFQANIIDVSLLSGYQTLCMSEVELLWQEAFAAFCIV